MTPWATRNDSIEGLTQYSYGANDNYLGDETGARAYYEWAARWAKTHELGATHAEELALFRVEAEEVLD